jgi:hypothetical protein
VDDAYSPYKAIEDGQLTPPPQYQIPQELPQDEEILSDPTEPEIVPEIVPEIEPEPPQQPDIESKKALLQILDKINASVVEVEVEVDKEVTNSDLRIDLKRCLHTPKEFKEDNMAFLRIWAQNPQDEDYSDTIFSGWMFSSNPALHSVEHPIYDVVLLKCLD